MANTVRILITAKDEVSGVFDKVRDKATALSKTDIGKGMAMGAGIAAFGMVKNAAMGALDAVVSFGAGSIEAASNLRESMALSQQVFEGQSAAMEDWAGEAVKSFGASKREALNYAATFGTAFKNVGMALDDVAERSRTMAELAGDLGSAFNTSSEEAAIALRSGLLGESEPMRKFGVFLSEAKVKALLLAQGIKPVNGAFTDAEKVMARYQIILNDTADSQGMFGRDSESLADSQKMLTRSMENAQAAIGEALLPVMVDLTNYMTDEGVPAILDFVEALKAIPDVIEAPGTWWDDMTSGVQDFIDTLPSNKDKGAESIKFIATLKEKLYDLKGTEYPAKKVSKALGGIGDAADGAAGSIGGVGDEAKAASDKFDDMTKSIEDLVDALITAAFEPEQLALELKLANRDVKDLQKELASMVDGNGKPVKGKTWKQVNEAKLELSEAKERAQKLKFQLDAVDGVSQSDITRAIKGLGGRVANAADEAADLWWYVNKLSKVQPTGVLGSLLYKNKYIPTHADGGPIPPYGLSLVGENGPELIRMGAVGGMVKPSAGVAPSQATASGGVTISGPFNFNGIGSDVSAQAANRFGQATLDVIANGLREQRARLGAA